MAWCCLRHSLEESNSAAVIIMSTRDWLAELFKSAPWKDTELTKVYFLHLHIEMLPYVNVLPIDHWDYLAFQYMQ